MATSKRLEVYSIRDTWQPNGRKEMTWHKAGVAWVNRDGSINVYLDVLPIDGKLHVREPMKGGAETSVPGGSEQPGCESNPLERRRAALKAMMHGASRMLETDVYRGEAKSTLEEIKRLSTELLAELGDAP